MGFGYNFDTNPNLQVIGTNTPSQASLTFNPGSANSIVEGIEGTMNIYTTNITIRRSWVTVNLYTSATNSGNDIRIESCALNYFTGSNNAYPSLNTQIYNCIFYGITFYNAASTGSVINCVTSSPNYATGFVNSNNANVLVKNSILPFNPANTNTVWENNFFNTAIPGTLPPGGNNRWSQSWATLFNRLGGTLESPGYIFATDFDEDYYILKAASPAINGGFDAGNNPTDCGIYGGELLYRYKLSGVPAVPAIYKLTAPGPAATSNPYNVTISVRSNN
jgi:hypothetical protein